MEAFRSDAPKFFVLAKILLCPEKFVLNIYYDKSNNLAPYQFILLSKP